MVAACAVLAIPATASAAVVNTSGTEVEVVDPSGFADDITYHRFSPWEIHITNSGGDPATPLMIGGDGSPTFSCLNVGGDPRLVSCVRGTGAPDITGVIEAGAGDDKVTVGAHGATEPVDVYGDSGNDTINTVNGRADHVQCGPGDNDTAVMDSFDTIIEATPNDEGGCEHTGGGGGSGGGGSGGGGGAGGGAGGGTGTTGGVVINNTTPNPVLHTNPPALYPAGTASKPGGKLLAIARVNGPGRVLGIATSKNRKLLARGEKTATKAGAVKVLLKPTKLAKRLLKGKRSIKVKLTLSFYPKNGAATVTKTISAKLRR